MGLFGKLLGWATWWDGAPLIHRLSIRKGVRVGSDSAGNAYYEGGLLPDGRKRRFVLYAGANDASRVPPEWHSWLHHSIDDLPDASLPPARRWEKEATPNLTGTGQAYFPPGAGGKRAAATGDYEAWVPEGA